LFWRICQDPSSRPDQAGTLISIIEQEDTHFDSRPGNPLTEIFHGVVRPLTSQACLGQNRSLTIFKKFTSCSIAQNHWRWNKRPHCQILQRLTPTRLHNGTSVSNPAWGTQICPSFPKSWD
jgi:hypothetical protein